MNRSSHIFDRFVISFWEKGIHSGLTCHVNSGTFDDFSYCFFEPELT